MKIQQSLTILAIGLGFGGFVWAGPSVAPAADQGLALPDVTADSVDLLSHGWKAKSGDNISGISDLNKVSNPATVDYDQLLEATPQIKRMKKEKIDPDSPQGKLLRSAARTLITQKCTAIRTQRGHCGIWKAIRHKDGRAVPDVTFEVLAGIKNEV